MPNSHLFKIIVVEDEPLILQNIIDKINALHFPLQIIGSATNGEDALSLIEMQAPDIVFTDIRMPVMDGLQLLEAISKRFPPTKVIIISGYDEFDYARTALKLGAYDYLLKPINIANLSDTLSRLCESLNHQAATYEEDILINELLTNTVSCPIPITLENTFFHIYLVCLKNLYNNSPNTLDAEAIKNLWNTLDLKTHLEVLNVQKKPLWLVDEKYPNIKILITERSPHAQVQQMFTNLSLMFQDSCSITVCYTHEPIGLHDLWVTTQHLKNLLFYALIPCTSSMISLKDGHFSPPSPVSLDAQLLAKIDVLSHSGQLDALSKIILNFLSSCHNKNISQHQLEESFLQLSLHIATQNPNLHIDLRTIKNHFYNTLADAINSDFLYSQLFSILSKNIFQVLQPQDSPEAIYRRIKKYIEDNFCSYLTLESLAETFHFSPSYITRIFKKYNGQPPIKYLLYLRIEEAKKLIVSSENLNLKVIAEMVGYPDPHYFSRIFKTHTGLSPSQYKHNLY